MRTATLALIMAVAAGLCAHHGAAQGWPSLSSAPSFPRMPREGTSALTASYLSMECDRDPSGQYRRMTCRFTQTMISRQSPERTRENLETAFSAWNENRPRWRREMRQACRESSEMSEQVICSCAPSFDDDCVSEKLAQRIRRNAERCDVMVNTYEKTLRRTGPYAWATSWESNPFLVEGPCHVTTSLVVSSELPRRGADSDRASLFTYAQSRAVIGSDDCHASYSSEESRHAWNAPEPDLVCNGFGR